MNEQDLEQPTREAWKGCADWLATCIRLGWQREELDALEALWWKYHDHRGRLKSDVSRSGSQKGSE